MRSLRIGVLRWAVGTFCAVVGALTFITPHQYEGPAYALLRPYLGWWGIWSLLAGAALLIVAVSLPRRHVAVAAHLFAAAPILLLAISAGRAGGLTGMIVYTVLGVGTVLAPWIGQTGGLRTRSYVGRDFFALLVGVSAVLIGVLMLASPGQFGSSIFTPIRPFLFWYGLAFVVGGSALVVVQLWPTLPTPLVWAAHLLAGGALFAFGPPVSIPNRAFTSFAYYNGFGLLIALLPFLRPRLRRIDRSSLRTRVALAVVLSTTLPLVVAVALTADQEQRSVTRQALDSQRALAEALANDVADFVQQNQSLLAFLASQPSLLGSPPDAQRELLRAAAAANQDVSVLALFDASGAPLARTDDRPLRPASDTHLFTEARRSLQPSVDHRFSALVDRPVLAFGQPILGPDRRFAGLVVSVVEATELAARLARVRIGERSQSYLVDADGRLIAHPDVSLVRSSQDLSDLPPVAQARGASELSGAVGYGGSTGDRLAGYARVPPLGWAVVVEQPAADALAGVQAARDLAFALLILLIGGSIVAGAVAAGWLTAPLATLERAADTLAAGDTSAPLPQSQITEVAHLAHAFAEMRDRLAARTADLERAEQTQRLLAEASKVLSSSLDYATTLQSMADLAVPSWADLCVVDIVGESGAVQRMAAAHAEPAKVELAFELRRRYPVTVESPGPAAEVLRTGKTRVVPEIGERELATMAHDAENLELLRALGHRSGIIAPLATSGRVFGVISFFSVESGRRYGPEDVPLIEELARRAAVAVDNARLYREAQEAIHARDEFLSIASHELRTPVAGIKGFAQLLLRSQRRGPTDPARLARSLGAIDRSADRLTALTQDLLDVSRIRLGKLPLRTRRLDLCEQVADVVERFQQMEGGDRLRIEQPGSAVPVEADPDRLEQVLTNVIENAVKYSPDGGDISIHIGIDADGAYVRVRDEGIGLPVGAAESIFEPFGRAANAVAGNLPGMGLGLHISRGIVERHGGRIWAESAGEGQGTTVWLRLPVPADGPRDALDAPPEAGVAPTSSNVAG